jgi:hypothetical protein
VRAAGAAVAGVFAGFEREPAGAGESLAGSGGEVQRDDAARAGRHCEAAAGERAVVEPGEQAAAAAAGPDGPPSSVTWTPSRSSTSRVRSDA